MVDALRGGLAEHLGDVGELADDRADHLAGQTDGRPAVLAAAQGRPPALGHRGRGHLGRDDVAVAVDDQRSVSGPAEGGPPGPRRSAGSPASPCTASWPVTVTSLATAAPPR